MIRLAGIAAVSLFACAVVGCAQPSSSDPPSSTASADTAPTTSPADMAWTESYDGALAQAKSENKLILADFTGSDWCHYCVQLRREVLNKPEFISWASSHVILLEVDYPRRKAQADDIKAQNERLKNQFNIDGYPTVVVMNADGKEVGRIVGYDGEKEWSQELQKIVK
jgi:protein disulfide-isomerase